MLITRKTLNDTIMQVYKMNREIMEKQQKAATAKANAAAPVSAPAAQALPPLPAAAVPAAKNVVPLK